MLGKSFVRTLYMINVVKGLDVFRVTCLQSRRDHHNVLYCLLFFLEHALFPRLPRLRLEKSMLLPQWMGWLVSLQEDCILVVPYWIVPDCIMDGAPQHFRHLQVAIDGPYWIAVIHFLGRRNDFGLRLLVQLLINSTGRQR